jgi:phosphoribosylaminoimidazolecarboxamide formyltransferase/IMP cyclohydrolase
MQVEKKNALLSVSAKEGITDFARGLISLGYSLISSGGTAKHLQKDGLEVVDIASITGFPAMLGHRVVTLHPNIHGGILALDTPEHKADLAKYKINRIHLVCVDLYHVQEAIAKEGATVESVMEEVDIGGPTLIRGAAKNHERVIVICDPNDRDWVLETLKLRGDLHLGQRRALAEKVFKTMADYDASIEKFMFFQRKRAESFVIQ